MNLFLNLRSKRIFYRILALLLAMAGLMFLMAFLFMRAYVAQSYEQRNRESARQLLSTASEYVNLAALDLGRSMQQMLWNTEVTAAILVPDEVSYQRKVEIVKTLSTFEQDHPLVERAYLLTYANQTLYDAQGNILPIKDSPERIYMKQFTAGVHTRILGTGDFSTVVLTVNGSVALLQDFPTPEENGALLIELQEDVLFQFLKETLEESGDYLEVTDPTGALIYAVGRREGVMDQPEHFAGQAGWDFRIWRQAGRSSPTLAQTVQLIGLWSLLFGAVSTAAAIFITWSIYRPIGRLRAVVEDEAPSDGENELEVVQRVYETTLRQKTNLFQEIAEMTPIVRDRLYKNLLYGRGMTQEYLIDRLAYLNSPFQLDDVFIVLAVEPGEGCAGSVDEMMGRLYQSIVKKRESRQFPSCQWECLLMDDYSLVMILSFGKSSNAAWEKKAQMELERFISDFGRQNGMGDALVMGRGKACRGIIGLRYSYAEAREDLSYRQYHGADAPEPPSAEADCRKILELAQNGDTDGAIRALEIQIRQLEQGDRVLKLECDFVVERMVETLLILHADEEKMQIFEAYYCGAEHADGGRLTELAQETCGQAIRLIAHYSQRNRNRYVAQARKYIQEHCTDSHLSLEMVAESVGIHSAYLSRLFYELSDVNFVNFVNGCRVEHAKLLLRQSKISVQEVGFRSGFNSMQNFNRVFKRHTGTTPGGYRKDATEQGGAGT